MVMAAWSPSGAALLSHHRCALSQISTYSDRNLSVTRTYSSKEQMKSAKQSIIVAVVQIVMHIKFDQLGHKW